MKPIDKLRELLCTVPEIKEDLMKLKFGCEVNIAGFKNINGEKYRAGIEIIECSNDYYIKLIGFNNLDYENSEAMEIIDSMKILGNPIQERHLRMYCEEMFENKDEYIFTIYGELQRIDTDMGEYLSTICKLDNTKDLQDQPDEVIESIVEFLEN